MANAAEPRTGRKWVRKDKNENLIILQWSNSQELPRAKDAFLSSFVSFYPPKEKAEYLHRWSLYWQTIIHDGEKVRLTPTSRWVTAHDSKGKPLGICIFNRIRKTFSEYQGRGIARWLLFAILKTLPKLQTLRLAVKIENDKALAVYEHLGFSRYNDDDHRVCLRWEKPKD